MTTEARVPRLSIVVCCHNGAARIGPSLEMLAAQTLAPEDYEILVVDNASTDGTAHVVADFEARLANLRRVAEPRPGKSRASNTGLLASRAPYVAFTDDDVAIPPDWGARILRDFDEGGQQDIEPKPVAVVGCVVARFDELPPPWLARLLDGDVAQRRSIGAGFLGPGRGLYVVYGANVAYERRALLAVGGFSEDWGPVAGDLRCGAEDTEALLRVGTAFPYVWFDPDLVIEHRESAASLRLGYRLWRKHLEGVAVSRLEGTVLFSRSTRNAVRRILRRSLAPSTETGAAPPAGPLPANAVVLDLLFRIAAIAGRVRGSRLFASSPEVPRRGSLPQAEAQAEPRMSRKS